MADTRGSDQRDNQTSEADDADLADMADVAEQEQEADPEDSREDPLPQPGDAHSRGEANEADTVDQLREVAAEDDDYR